MRFKNDLVRRAIVLQGFLNLNKPAGLTSHDCVAKVRRMLNLKRVGHGGTLDPAAVGVLPIAVGRATRLLPYLPTDKAYEAVIRFGLTTSTDDLEGEVLTQAPVPHLSQDQVETVLPNFVGTIDQIPPRYSAIQVQGQRLYDLARKGEVVDVPMRTVEIYRIQVLDWQSGEYPELRVAIACGSGTYIRSIARDLGQQLGTGATLAHLTRTHSSGFDLIDSITLEQILNTTTTQADPPLITPDIALQHLPQMTLTEAEAHRWCQGQAVTLAAPPSHTHDITQIRNPTGDFLGIGSLSTRPLTPEDTTGSLTPSTWIVIPKMVFTPIA